MQLSEQLARAITSMGRLIHDFQGEELSRTDFIVLVRLALPGTEGAEVRSRDLARAEGLDPSTMSRRLGSLADRGLIGRRPDPADGRASLLSLTDAGAAAVGRERARRVALVTDALDGWAEHDRAELARLLSQLTDSLEARRADRRERSAP
ncbi:MarR family winged helix-turn-helix transcriptional regulator [Ornithinimicrobium pekingense]|uniref:Transcriptional regulator n=1 Tax=Ornithinimicrobium pekingense TaxID=384677 RepID=A0ABQ2F9T3_9MICO|nr:MarR family transcriptional regulator [Ornithinimicrobium pekingense]GGK72590.1 transcriptional regulator [Ornithinimicrobium pekingense]